MITAAQVEEGINDPEFYHAPLTSMVSIENTTNKGGGACYQLEELQKIKEVCTRHQLRYHLDGARLWNAMIARKQHPKQFGDLFDTISVCFSKGLGCPIGSVLISDAATIHRALRIRKIFGGNMRQSGYLAAAGIYALQHNINRLADDHFRAQELEHKLKSLHWVASVAPTETNIVIFTVKKPLTEAVVIQRFKMHGIQISSMGHGKLRMVTHLDYRQIMHEYVLQQLDKMEF